MTSDRLTANPAFIGHMCRREVAPIGGLTSRGARQRRLDGNLAEALERMNT